MTEINLCLRCRKKRLTCVCHLLKPFNTVSRFIILMHPMEYKKVGTGRLAHLILKNSQILVGINFDQEESVKDKFYQLLEDPEFESYLLYPGEKAIPLETNLFMASNELKKKSQFFILDGTWPCAKKMIKETSSLQKIPRVSFSQVYHSEFATKHQPLKGCLSTIESIDRVLCELKRMKIESSELSTKNLMDVFRHTVHQQLKLASDPSVSGYRRKPYSSPEQRRISKKWSTRSLFFSE